MSDSFCWPKGSERLAGASLGGPSVCPFALHGPFWPPLVTCVSAVCPGTWCWWSGREILFCWLCRRSGTWSQWSHRPSRSPLEAVRRDKTTDSFVAFCFPELQFKLKGLHTCWSPISDSDRELLDCYCCKSQGPCEGLGPRLAFCSLLLFFFSSFICFLLELHIEVHRCRKLISSLNRAI